ncbi:MAG: thaumatin family protein [Legionellales bacterium]
MLLNTAARHYIGGMLFFLTCTAVAAKDPIGWSLSPASGFPAVKIGSHSSVTYTLTNNLPFPAVINTEHLTSGGTFGVYDQCRNLNLAPNKSCIVHVNFTPTHTGQASFQMIYGYHYNKIPLPVLTANGGGADNEEVVGYISNFPSLITLVPLETPQFTVTYANHSAGTVTGYAGNSSGLDVFQISPAVASVTIAPGTKQNTCGTSVAPGTIASQQSCYVNGQITPSTTGTFILTGLYTYNNGTQTAMPTAKGRIQQNGSACGLTPATMLPLPTQTYPYSDNVVKFTFTNQCASTPVALGPVTIATRSGSVPATITQNPNITYDTCSNKTLAGGGQCFVLASVIPNTTQTGELSVKATVSNGVNTYEAHTNSSVVANSTAGQNHQVHFINQCNFNVWYGIENGATGTVITPDPTPGAGTANNDNAYYLAAAIPGQAPTPTSSGGIRNLSVANYTNGAIWARTNCAYNNNQFACQTGMCNTQTNSATCVPSDSTETVTPNLVTKLEFTIVSNPGSDGVYDVSLENGFNVSAEVKGLGPFVSGSPLKCTGAGAPLQPANNQLGSCSWALDPTQAPSNLARADFLLLTPGNLVNCSNDNDCSAYPGTICGMAFGALNTGVVGQVNPTPINRVCGNFLGYSNLDNYNGYPSSGQWETNYNLYSKYQLGTTLSTLGYSTYGDFSGNPATFGNMISCQTTNNGSLNTCYPNPGVITNPDQYNFANCCGCVDWSLTGLTYNGGLTCPITIPNYPTPVVNAAWTQTATVPVSAENAIYWFKAACPTAYSFPFDDPSSSFTCTENASGKPLNTDYQVVYCPGGLSGLATGATEGR